MKAPEKNMMQLTYSVLHLYSNRCKVGLYRLISAQRITSASMPVLCAYLRLPSSFVFTFSEQGVHVSYFLCTCIGIYLLCSIYVKFWNCKRKKRYVGDMKLKMAIFASSKWGKELFKEPRVSISSLPCYYRHCY